VRVYLYFLFQYKKYKSISIMLPIARPIYSDVEIVEIVPLIEPTEHCAFTKKTIYDICASLFCFILLFTFLFYMFFIL